MRLIILNKHNIMGKIEVHMHSLGLILNLLILVDSQTNSMLNSTSVVGETNREGGVLGHKNSIGPIGLRSN